MKHLSIALSEHWAEFVNRQMQSGRYANANDVVCAGLRLLEEHNEHIRAVADALAAGERSGEPELLHLDAFLIARRKLSAEQ